MQCSTVTTVTEKETIHSGHFMISHFDSEAQDEDEIAVSIPDGDTSKLESDEQVSIADEDFPVPNKFKTSQQLSIETSLTKLFQCMSLAYRQKLTSPKWNRFKGIRLRWKDKIRLNNLIWRCWHMQFIMKQNTLVCQFASPLDVDTHNKPEAVVLEGKYWKRRLNAVTAEYKKWRLFHRNRLIGCSAARDALGDVDLPDWPNQGSDYDIDSSHMLVDEDYMEFMTDTLFSTISANQPYPFPDSREIARAGLADFIQPSLGPLQPNLEDFMDTLEPLQEYRYKLPPVPEEPNTEEMYRPIEEGYSELDLLPSASNNNIEESAMNDLPDLIDQTQNISNQSQITFTNDKQFDQNFCNMNSSLQIFESNASIGSSNTNNQQNNQNQNIRSQPLFDRVQDISRYQTFEVISPNRTTLMNALESNTFKMPSPPPSNQRQAYKFPTSIGKNISFTNQAGQSSDFKMPTAPTNSQCWSPPSASQHQTFLPVASTQETNIMQLPNTLTKESSQQQNDAFLLASAKYASPTQKGRARSSSLGPRQGPPPLKASSSDPALVSSTNSVLLAQLLSNSSQSVFNLNSRTQNDKLNRIKAGSSSDLVSILPMQNTNAVTTTLLITSPIMMTPQQSTSQNQVVGTSFGSTASLTSGSPKSMSIESPVSPLSPIGSPGMRAGSGGIHKDQRRAGHIHAEQKRRYNIKNGFDMLHSLIPQLNQNPNAKLSKAAMLQKGAQYIRQLQSERNQLKEEIDSLRQQIDCLNTSISNCQSLLPATGAPISRQRTNKMREMFDDYVRVRTLMNWKFWIFSLFFEPLLTSYTNCVSTSSMDELYSSTLLWIEQHCSLVDLRPVVLNSLKYLCTKTEILNEPSRLSEEARQAVSEMQHKTQQ